jgi:hypothetical protein
LIFSHDLDQRLRSKPGIVPAWPACQVKTK